LLLAPEGRSPLCRNRGAIGFRKRRRSGLYDCNPFAPVLSELIV